MLNWLRYMFARATNKRIQVGDISFCPVSGYSNKGKLTYSSFLRLRFQHELEVASEHLKKMVDRQQLWRDSRLKRLLNEHLNGVTVEQYEAFAKIASEDYKEFM